MTPDDLQQREKNLLPEYLKNGNVYLRALWQNFTTEFQVASMRLGKCVAERQNTKTMWSLNVETLFIFNISNDK